MIGVFHPQDPFAVMTEERVSATVAECAGQQVQLVFFNESGIDLDRRTVEGKSWVSGRWEDGVFPFPQAVMNARPWGPRRRSDRELIFRKIVPFTAFLIDDKWTVTRMVSANPSLSPYVVPTAVLRDAEQVDELLQSHAKLVIKPAQGSRGAGVQALAHNGSHYGVQNGAEWLWLDRKGLSAYIRSLDREYLVQPYIVCLTPEGEPFDFRVLVQRNGEGDWVVAVIYPRIGAKGTITSNVSVGGRTEPLEAFLKRAFPEDGDSFPPRLAKLGLEIAEFVDSRYANPLNELGIDIAVDDRRKFWFYEANTCPGTFYHEKERAVLAVAYAKYIGGKASPDGFAPPPHFRSRPTLGLMFHTPPSAGELEAYADVSAVCGVQLVYFFTENVSLRAASISGFWRDGGRWMFKNFPVPDVVYNATEPGELDSSHPLYRPGSDWLFTSREPKGPISSPLFFAVASRNRLLAEHLPLTLRPEHPEAARRFVDDHRLVVMKPDNPSRTEDIMTIQRFPTHYVVKEGSNLHSFRESEFSAFLKLFEDSGYMLIQHIDSKTRDGHALHIRVYLFRRPDGSWEAVHIAPLLSLASADPRNAYPFAVSWDWLLNREFDRTSGEEIDLRLRTLAETAAKQLQSSNRNRIHELILDFAVDPNRVIRMLGGTLEGLGGAVHTYDIARRLVPYALSLLQTKYEKTVRQV